MNSAIPLSLTLLALASAAAPGAAAPGAAARHPFRVGEPVPDLILPSAEDGAPRSLADFRGRKLILQVFASW